jgi:hypothetical protein
MMRLRILAKQLVAADAAAGRRSLVEAAALFAALDDLPPAVVVVDDPWHAGQVLPHLPGRTAAERRCVQVMAYALGLDYGEPSWSARAAVVRLEAEYRRELANPAPLQLPGPVSRATVEDILAQVRAGAKPRP